MDKQEMFTAAAQIRRETADWLLTLDQAQLDRPSLCGDWRVRDVAGHLVAPLTTGVPAMLWRTVRSGMNPHRANTSLARAIAARPVAELAADLRDNADLELDVPFVGVHGPFTDLLVHNADMRVPLDQPWQPAVELSVESLGFLSRGAVGFTSKKRLAGLRIVATDADASYGEGAELHGPAFDLVLALCGRRVGLEALGGPGRDLLATRLG